VLSLAALANWETAVLSSIRGATGSIEEKDAQITRSGMYAEYPAIFSTYLDLLRSADDPATRLEALKRSVFLAWYSVNALPVVSGIAELPETDVREVMRELDSAMAGGRVDEELRRMLRWYRDTFGYPFEHFGPVRHLSDFLDEEAGLNAGAADVPKSDSFHGRGQMGEYWRMVAGHQ
jgi:hypothetical protein